MADKRKVEVFSAGCGLCDEAVELVKKIACPSCEVTVHDMKNIEVVKRAKALGVRSVPAVVVNGKLASEGGVDEASLRAAGVGQPT